MREDLVKDASTYIHAISKGFERYKLGFKTEELIMLARIRCLVPSSPQIQKSKRLREEKVEY